MSDLSHDIERYLRGEMTPAEMHALEKRALDDPFLSDSLEGGASIPIRELSDDLSSLKAELAERIPQKKIIPLWLWAARIAAGALVVALGTFIVLNFVNDNTTSDGRIASSEKPQIISPTEPALPSDSALIAVDEEAKPPEDKKLLSMNSAKESNESSSAGSVAPLTNDDLILERDQAGEPETEHVVVAEQAPASSPPAEVVVSKAEVRKDEPEISPEPAAPIVEERKESPRSKRKASTVSARYANSTSKAQEKNTQGFLSDSVRIDGTLAGRVSGVAISSASVKVQGRITSSDDGTPLPGVNVIIKGTSTGTVTNAEGYYLIELADPNTTLVYSFIGLTSTERPVSNSPEIDVIMDQDVSQLSEVVVVGYSTTDSEKIEDASAYSTFEMAEPVGGKREFKKYLQDNLVYPQVALQNKVEGKVTIQFTVETTGSLSEFRILKGIGYGCDDEVIRLIKSGPKWSPIKRNTEPLKGRVKVRMRFALPGKK